MEVDVFSFKHFRVSHSRSSMKVGVDAVLLGAWANAPHPLRVLDAGTGCGVIALIMAFRFQDAEITGIDTDEASVDEAATNFRQSGWSARLRAIRGSFPEILQENDEKYDLIISNPPYFASGITSPSTPREKARHQGSLSPLSLVEHSRPFLRPDGRLAMIFPAEFREKVRDKARGAGLFPIRECFVRNNARRPEKRIMAEFGLNPPANTLEEHLTLFEGEDPTASYRNLCRDLYLKF